MGDLQELTKSFIIKMDAKYNLFHIDEKNEEDLILFYQMFEPYIKKFADKGLNKLEEKFNLDVSALTLLVISMIKKIETFDHLSGPEKKEMVVNVLVMLVERELPIPGPAKFLVVQSIELLVPVLIDRLVELSKTINNSSKFKKFCRKLKRVFCCGKKR